MEHTNDTQRFKERLEKEKQELETELSSVGKVNPSNVQDWEATPPSLNIQEADQNERADRIEEYEERSGIVNELETRYVNVRRALEKIERGTFGMCEIDNKPIEIERLEANPAARTCKEHIDQVDTLVN